MTDPTPTPGDQPTHDWSAVLANANPTLERLQVVNLRPGDLVIGTLTPGATQQLAEAVGRDLARRFPDNPTMILPPGVGMHAVRWSGPVTVDLPAGWRLDVADNLTTTAHSDPASDAWFAFDAAMSRAMSYVNSALDRRELISEIVCDLGNAAATIRNNQVAADEGVCICSVGQPDPQCPRHAPEPDAEWPR